MALRADDLRRPFAGEAVVYKFPQRPAARVGARDRAALVLVSVAALLGLVAGSWQGTSSATSPGGRTATSARTVVVQPGDTLWALAERHAPEGTDVRSYMEEILALNGRVPALAPGWRIELPR